MLWLTITDKGRYDGTGSDRNSGYVAHMNRFFRAALLLVVWSFFLSGCASEDVTSNDSALKTGGAVPGEKTGDDAMSATAGPGTAAAGVRW